MKKSKQKLKEHFMASALPPSGLSFTSLYSLDRQGTLFCVEGGDNKNSVLKENDGSAFQKLEKPFLATPKITQNGNNLTLRIEVAGCKRVDIIVNNVFLCIYGKRPRTLQNESIIKSTTNFEYLTTIGWKEYFPSCSLEEMKNKVRNHTKLKLKDGIFEMTLSKI